MCKDAHLRVGGAVSAHHEHVGGTPRKVCVESVVETSYVINFFKMSAGCRIVVDCHDQVTTPPCPWVASMKALRKEAVPHTEVVGSLARRGLYMQSAR